MTPVKALLARAVTHLVQQAQALIGKHRDDIFGEKYAPLPQEVWKNWVTAFFVVAALLTINGFLYEQDEPSPPSLGGQKMSRNLLPEPPPVGDSALVLQFFNKDERAWEDFDSIPWGYDKREEALAHWKDTAPAPARVLLRTETCLWEK